MCSFPLLVLFHLAVHFAVQQRQQVGVVVDLHLNHWIVGVIASGLEEESAKRNAVNPTVIHILRASPTHVPEVALLRQNLLELAQRRL